MIGKALSFLAQPRAKLEQPLFHADLGGCQAALHRGGNFLELQVTEEPQPQGIGLHLRQAGQQDVQVAAAFAG